MHRTSSSHNIKFYNILTKHTTTTYGKCLLYIQPVELDVVARTRSVAVLLGSCYHSLVSSPTHDCKEDTIFFQMTERVFCECYTWKVIKKFSAKCAYFAAIFAAQPGLFGAEFRKDSICGNQC